MGIMLNRTDLDRGVTSFSAYYADAEREIREFLDSYYETMCDLRRKYRVAFVDIANMAAYDPKSRLLIVPSKEGSGLDVFYWAEYSSGLPYLKEITLPDLDDLEGKLRFLHETCENKKIAIDLMQAEINERLAAHANLTKKK